MFKELFVLLEHLIAPESSWSRFLRKLTLLFTTSVVSIVSFHLWFVEQRETALLEGEQSIVEVIKTDKKTKSQLLKVLQQYLMVEQIRKVESVWVYSWASARGFTPIVHVGADRDPLPLGYWFSVDEKTVGALALGRCENLIRETGRVHACPISGKNRTWGMVVVKYKPEVTQVSAACKTRIAAVAHKISQILY